MPDSPKKSETTSPRRNKLDSHLDALRARRIAPSDAGSIRRAYVGESTPATLTTVADLSPADVTTVDEAPPSARPLTRVVDTARAVELARVRVDRHYSKTLNAITDTVLRTLQPAAGLVYVQLYRLSYGNGRNWCRVGHPKLAERTGIAERTVRRAVAQLLDRGLVVAVGQEFGGPQKGTVYLVPPPPGTPADSITVVDSARVDDITTVDSVAGMKEKSGKEDHETPLSVFDIRKEAAKIFELHRHDPGFSHARLRELVVAALVGQGRAVDAEAVEEAIKGMAG